MDHERIILQKCDDGDGRRISDIARVVEILEELPYGQRWRVTIEEQKSERSLEQNNYLFGVAYKLLSDRCGYEKDDLHEYLLGKHFGVRLKKIPKTKYNPQGLEEIPVRTTTTDENGRRSVLGKQPFGEYVEFVQRFAAKIGVVIPDPDKDYASKRGGDAEDEAA